MADCKHGVSKRTGACLKNPRDPCRKTEAGKIRAPKACSKAKRRSSRRGSRKKIKHQGVTVVLPKGTTKMTPALANHLDDIFTASEWNAAKGGACRLVFFTAKDPVLRCEKNRGSWKRVGGLEKAAKSQTRKYGLPAGFKVKKARKPRSKRAKSRR